jgi:23S rRNA pseudouridine1911/1915/1917 synthase
MRNTTSSTKTESPRAQAQQRVPSELAGLRFDQIAADLFPDFSRSRLQSWIKNGELVVDGAKAKPTTRLRGGECLALDAELQVEGEWQAQNIPVDVIFEDEHLLVLNKPVGLVVHPGAGNWDGTLLNALLFHHPELERIPRAGIVHRLDKDTSGLMVVAKTLLAQNHLVEQLQSRSLSRRYLALVFGELHGTGVVETLIDRHPTVRTRMAVVKAGGKEAITHYKVVQRYEQGLALVECRLETGRTHQIRVHMTHLGHPLVGDSVYKHNRKQAALPTDVCNFPRQALHARALGLIHPQSKQQMSWEIELPPDLSELLDTLSPCSS